ncbi:MAG: hypothetical protein H7Y15_07250 [Pseudonocardia sp.]|nr:hypothetical protein [Pseudonocardia sp.]
MRAGVEVTRRSSRRSPRRCDGIRIASSAVDVPREAPQPKPTPSRGGPAWAKDAVFAAAQRDRRIEEAHSVAGGRNLLLTVRLGEPDELESPGWCVPGRSWCCGAGSSAAGGL